jgi:hypothetical protein
MMGRLKWQRDKRGAAMEVEYELTAEDFMAFIRHHHARLWYSGLSWRWLVLLFFPAMMTWVNLTGPPAPPQEPPPPLGKWAAVFVVTAGAVALLLLVVACRLWVRPYLLAWLAKPSLTDPENRKRWLGWRRTVIGPDGLSVRGDGIDSTVEWTTIQKIPATRKHAFLYMTTAVAIIVPRRAFVSDADFRNFVATARAYRETALSAPHEGSTLGGEPPDEMDTDVTPVEDPGARGGAVMEVEFVQTVEDVFALAEDLQKWLPWWKRNLHMLTVSVGLLCLTVFIVVAVFPPGAISPVRENRSVFAC